MLANFWPLNNENRIKLIDFDSHLFSQVLRTRFRDVWLKSLVSD